MTRREPSLFTRLVLTIALVLALGAGALVTAASYYARAAANEAYDRLLIGAALQVAEDLSVQEGRLVPDVPLSAFEMLALSERDRIFYRIIGVDGATLTGYDDLTADLDLAQARRQPVTVGGVYRGEPVRIAVVSRAITDPGLSGHAYVLMAQTELSRGALAQALTIRASILVSAMSLIALAGVVFAVRYALSPLLQVAAALRARDPHDLTPLRVATPREIGPFVDATNYFMERLRGRIDTLQRFIADAAHQIRTPLTALSAQVELISATPDGLRDGERVARIRQRTDQLARLTNQLLSHAMVIHRSEAVPFVAVDLVTVARRALREGVPITLSGDLVVTLEAPDRPVTVQGEPVSLREALANVIDNAVRHGERSRLTVRIVADDPDRITIDVEDDGEGIPPADWTRVTRRFGGGEPGETRTGLGLAIAAEVCAAHGGTLSFHTVESGFVVRLTLPRSGGR